MGGRAGGNRCLPDGDRSWNETAVVAGPGRAQRQRLSGGGSGRCPLASDSRVVIRGQTGWCPKLDWVCFQFCDLPLHCAWSWESDSQLGSQSVLVPRSVEGKPFSRRSFRPVFRGMTLICYLHLLTLNARLFLVLAYCPCSAFPNSQWVWSTQGREIVSVCVCRYTGVCIS